MADQPAANPAANPAAKPDAPAGLSAPPTLDLPKAGGALRAMGEKFGANPVNGTSTVSVPIALSPGRGGFGPQLALSYDSGAGNGPFGFGWTLSLPAITRRTDRGLPRYDDAGESDVFVLSGAEDLVPVTDPGTGKPAEHERAGYRVRGYRPRVESGFSRIERWTSVTDPTDVHWRTLSPDNVLSRYGADAGSRIHDPADPTRIFSWLLCETRDPVGNAMRYDHVGEDDAGIDPTAVWERHRDATARTANRYLKRIRYGNHVPLLDADGHRPWRLTDEEWAAADWLFEVVLDYGEHDESMPRPAGTRPWAARDDQFSSYRSGFEIRTVRLCRRVLMFHHFPAEPGVGRDCLVRSTTFGYGPTGGELPGTDYAFLDTVTQTSHRRDGDGYRSAGLPPLTFIYQRPVLDPVVRTVDRRSTENLPAGLADPAYRWVDLHGEGTPGVLAEQAGGWFYKANMSPLGEEVRLGPAEPVAPRPNVDLATARFLDVDGDGRVDLVVLRGPDAGYYPHDGDRAWQSFRPFRFRPPHDPDDPHVRLTDLDGDGRADLLAFAEDTVEWYPSLGEAGFGNAAFARTGTGEEHGPRTGFAGDDGSVHLADMTGDGLDDLVRVRNGSVCYWPNLGHGWFGKQVTMAGAPRLDGTDRFTQARLQLADVDGSGTSDLIYRRGDQVVICFNRCGNSWSEPHVLNLFPHLDDTTTLTVADLLGNGTACLVWSSPLPADAGTQLRYVDLMGGHKPHLLSTTDNGMGARTVVHYDSSSRHYLRDRADGRPWPHPLAFPVQVVERVEILDLVGGNRFVTRYAYHDGHYDGQEREFRGFGQVDQWDTEEYDVLAASGAAGNEDPGTHVAPVLTRTWYHTGALPGPDDRTRHYYREPDSDDEWLLPDDVTPTGLSDVDERETYRALKGSMLRREVYAEDGTSAAAHPYTVTGQNLAVRVEQPRGHNRHAVLFPHPLESLTAHYERNPHDPRIQHQLTLEVDAYGQTRREMSVAYPRRQIPTALPAADRAPQVLAAITYTVTTPTGPVDDPATPDDYRVPMPADVRTYEITGCTPVPGVRFRPTDWTGVDDLPEVPYEDTPGHDHPRRRLIEHARTLYRPDDLGATPDALLPLGTVEPLALAGTMYKLALTPGLITSVLRRDGVALIDDPAEALGRAAGYHDGDELAAGGVFPAGDPPGCWWQPAGRVLLSPSPDDDAAAERDHARRHFFLPRRYRSPLHRSDFDTESTVERDQYDLLIVRSTDALGNATIVGGNDYRLQQPVLIADPNGNRNQVALDILGLVVGTAAMGRTGEHLGDTLAGFDPDPPAALLAAALAGDPEAVRRLLGGAGTRVVHDLFAHLRTAGEPPVVLKLVRETHEADLAPGTRTRIARSYSYSDGFGREIQKRANVEPARDTPDVPRWVVTGWQVFNNKGKAVRSYEPFFAGSPRFERDTVVGVSPVRCYDPAERVVATLLPDGTFQKVVFSPWLQSTWDGNDTVLGHPATDVDVRGLVRGNLPDGWRTWHERRVAGEFGKRGKEAAAKAAVHAGTPTVVHTDVLGRPFRTESDARVSATPAPIAGRIVTDIEGNKRAVRDGLGRIIVTWDYDLLGHQLCQTSTDAGRRWMLADVLGKPVRTWDERGHELRTENDVLHRPVRSQVVHDGTATLTEVMEYGEAAPNATARNLRGRLWRRSDQSGRLTTRSHDFKGNLVGTSRRLATDYRMIVDWSADPALDAERFEDDLAYDAMNRPVHATTPHERDAPGCQVRTTYDLSGAIDRIDATLFGDGTETAYVTEVDHDAMGRRARIAYGNGTVSRHEYDPESFRLTRLSTRSANGAVLQDLRYTYDPVGNVTHIADAAKPTVFFRNTVVPPGRDHTYDATYRLVRATSREHLGQGRPAPWSARDESRMRLPHPGDGTAMTRYTEHYDYDEAGNLLRMRHRTADTSNGGWTREFGYDEPSRLEPDQHSNRLSTTTIGSGTVETYGHDAHGNMVSMPHLNTLVWDYKDQLRATTRTGDRTTFHTYDGTGARVRTVTERAGRMREDRRYLGGVEIHQVHDGRRAGLVRQSLHVMAGDQRIALVEQRNEVDDGTRRRVRRFQLADHLGSSVVELDHRGRVITFEEFTPYGATSYQAVRGQRQARKRYRFCGRERDAETGLAYHGARYYAPWLCRWTTCDPIGVGDGVNLYAYTGGNPVTTSDPTGRAGEKAVTLGDLILYLDKVKDRALVGANVQKDHGISQAIIKDILGPLEKLYKPGRDLTTVVETGAASGSNAAQWHTVKSTLEKPIQAAVKVLAGEGKAFSLGETVVAPVAEVLKSASGAQALTRQQYLGMLSQLGNVHATTTLEQAGKIAKLTEAGDVAKLTAYVDGLAKSTTGVAKWTKVLRGIATSENALAAAAKVADLTAKAAPLLSKLAPAVKVLGKVAGPLGIGIGAGQIVTAKTDEQRIDGGITAVSSALMMSKHPVAIAGGAGLMAGQAIEKSLDVSKYASEAGITVYEGLKEAGVNDTVAFVTGGVATVLATPSAIGYAAAAKVSSWFD